MNVVSAQLTEWMASIITRFPSAKKHPIYNNSQVISATTTSILESLTSMFVLLSFSVQYKSWIRKNKGCFPLVLSSNLARHWKGRHDHEWPPRTCLLCMQISEIRVGDWSMKGTCQFVCLWLVWLVIAPSKTLRVPPRVLEHCENSYSKTMSRMIYWFNRTIDLSQV